MRIWEDFREITLLDFEYCFTRKGPAANTPVPVCACAFEVRSKREFRLWANQLRGPEPLWAHGRDVLFISFNCVAELSCYAALGWAAPPFVLDLLIEYRQLKNGVLPKHLGRDLATIMARHNLLWIDPANKKEMQALILTGGPFTSDEQKRILDYCWTDVAALQALLPWMQPQLPVNLDACLYRGRYTLPVTATELTGIPADETTWNRILARRQEIQLEIIDEHPVYDGTRFDNTERFPLWLKQHGLMEWPYTATGKPSTKDKTFRSFSFLPEVEALRQIRSVVEQLRKPSFTVKDGRNYFSILPFKAESSRNATIGCLFQAPSWLRGLIQPAPGRGLIYADYAQEEYFIAGWLANDPEMLRLYSEGDPYIAFALMAGLVPTNATKKSHPAAREIAKTVSLASMYGQKVPSMSRKLGISINRTEDLLRANRERFPDVWRWFNHEVMLSYARGYAVTRLGWRLATGPHVKATTIRNFPVQGTGADVMRCAHHLLFESGINVAAVVHDSFLCACAETDLESTKAQVLALMAKAGKCVLGDDSVLRADARVLRYPERLIEPRGAALWDRVLKIVDRLDSTPATVSGMAATSVIKEGLTESTG
jgi:hypothetical protein